MSRESYKAAIEQFCDGGACDLDGVKERHAEVAAIAARFKREIARVELDINRAYLASWRPKCRRRRESAFRRRELAFRLGVGDFGIRIAPEA